MDDFKRIVRNAARESIHEWRDDVTDRRQRQRAEEMRPEGSNCFWCGHPHRLMVAHVDGDESNTDEDNLGLTCRSCNAIVANEMKSAGVGRRIRQYNPRRKHGAETLGQWMAAIMSMRGESDQMTVRQAVDMIHRTDPTDRSYFAREIWRLRRQQGTAGRGSLEEAPF